MQNIKSKWQAFYIDHIEQASKEIFGHIEKMIVATLIISAGAHVSSTDPAILLFGYLRHSLVGRGSNSSELSSLPSTSWTASTNFQN